MPEGRAAFLKLNQTINMKTAAVAATAAEYRSILPIAIGSRDTPPGLERLQVLPKAFGMPSIQMICSSNGLG